MTDLCGMSSCAKVISVSGDDKMLEFKVSQLAVWNVD